MKKTKQLLLMVVVFVLLALVPAKTANAWVPSANISELKQLDATKDSITYSFIGKNAISYNVYCRFGVSGDFQLVDTLTTDGTHTLNGLQSSSVYYIKVCGVNSENKESYSPYVKAVTLIDTVKNLHQDKWYKYIHSMDIKWDKLESATGYEYKVTTYKGKKITSGSMSSNFITDFSVNKIDNNMIYIVSVRAKQDFNNKTIYTPWAKINCFVQPTVKSASWNKNQLTIKWGAVKGATKYVVYASTSNAKNTYKKIATVSSKKTSCVIKKIGKKKLSSKKTYYVYVTTVYKNSKSQPVYYYRIKGNGTPYEGHING